MAKLADAEQVVRDPTHELAGTFAVVEAERQGLQVIEQLLPHPALDLGPHDVALVVDKEGAKGL